MAEENPDTDPLIRHQQDRWAVVGPSNNGSSNESIRVVLLSSAVAICGSFVFGICVGYSAPTQAGITQDLGLSVPEYSVFGSILTFGAMIGAIMSGRIADFVGRKGAMTISTLICLIGWLTIYFAKNALMLYIGRLSTGYGIGVASYVVPVFIAEISPKNLRGGLTTLNQLLICAGSSTALIVGNFITWRSLALIGLIPCIVLFAGLFFIPESPRWLAKVGRQKEFEVALKRLRGKDANISQEAAEIQEYIETLDSLPKVKLQDLFQRRYIRSVIVGVGLMVFQQFGGVNGILFYASETFVAAGFSSGELGTILIGALTVPITALGVILMDRTGRRPLLLVSTSGTFIGCFLAGISFYFKGQGIFTSSAPMLALAGILVFKGAFSVGMGSVPWVIMSEIFPINIKGIAGSLVTLVNWFGSWLVSYTFNFLMSWSSAGKQQISTIYLNYPIYRGN